jgi:hypothetical protein
MPFMALEEFKDERFSDIRERFHQKGRMLPDGVEYRASGVTSDGKHCFQVMESLQRELLIRLDQPMGRPR